jgi:hypothetical protein
MNDAITGQTECGWSLKRSPASIEASSTTHAPFSGDECFPGANATI